MLSIEDAKRDAKRLHKSVIAAQFGIAKLSAAQALIAASKGYENWHSLEEASKKFASTALVVQDQPASPSPAVGDREDLRRTRQLDERRAKAEAREWRKQVDRLQIGRFNEDRLGYELLEFIGMGFASTFDRSNEGIESWARNLVATTKSFEALDRASDLLHATLAGSERTRMQNSWDLILQFMDGPTYRNRLPESHRNIREAITIQMGPNFLARPTGTILDIEDLRQIVSDSIGEQYVLVIASGIDRYLTSSDKKVPDESEVQRLAVRAREVFDLYPNLFMGAHFGQSGDRVPVGTRRELIARYLSSPQAATAQIESMHATGGGKGAESGPTTTAP